MNNTYKKFRFNKDLIIICAAIIFCYFVGHTIYNYRVISTVYQKNIFQLNEIKKYWYKHSGYVYTVVLQNGDTIYFENLGNCDVKLEQKEYLLDIAINTHFNGTKSVDFVDLKQVFCN